MKRFGKAVQLPARPPFRLDLTADALRRLASNVVDVVGENGTLYRALPPRIEAVNPIGSGDSLLAGIVDGWLARLEPEALLKHGIACAVANALVWDAGAIEREEVERWEREVVVEPVAGRRE